MRIPPALAAAAAIVVVVVGGILLIGRPGASVGGPSVPTPSPTVTPTPSGAPSPSTAPTPFPALTQSFVSARHGYRISYPAGWTVIPATAPWPLGTEAAAPSDPMLDELQIAGETTLFVGVSQRVPAGVTADAWLTTYEASAPQMPAICWPAPAQMEKATIDGTAASVHGGAEACGFTEAVTFKGGRVYEFTGYAHLGVFDRALFDALIATIHLDPASADDTPVASPTPS